MKITTGINQGAYCGARWYSVTGHIFDFFLLQLDLTSQHFGDFLFDWGWNTIHQTYGPLNRQDFISEIRHAHEIIDIVFYHKEQYKRGKNELAMHRRISQMDNLEKI
jgi:hypothetical protein